MFLKISTKNLRTFLYCSIKLSSFLIPYIYDIFLSIIIEIIYNTHTGATNNEVHTIPILTEIFVAMIPIIGPPKI